MAVSVSCVYLIEAFFFPGTLEPFAKFGLASIFFLCGLGITKCVKLFKLRKSHLVEPSGALVYEHSMERKWKPRDFTNVSYTLLWVFITAMYIWRLPHEHPDFWFAAVSYVLMGIFWVLRLCSFLYGFWNYEPKITITLYERELNVSYPDPSENFLSNDVAFPIDEIADARIVTAKGPEIRQHVNVELFGRTTISTKVKVKSGPYMYALFLSKDFPLSDGHQAVDLKLENGRHVLIETDDAENFLAAPRKNGIGRDD